MRMRFRCLLLAALLVIYAALPMSAAAVASGSVSAGDVTSASDVPQPGTTPAVPDDQDVLETTASQIADKMNLGWNLGDSLDSWSSDAGYDDYHNSNAYQLVLRYDNEDHVRSTSIATPFDENNKCTYKWATGLIDTDENAGLGDIGFEIWNLTVEEEVTVTIKVTRARLTRRTGVAYDMSELLGEHTITISKYGTTAVLTEKFPSQLSRTYGITDGTFEVSVELIDFPQKEYSKAAYFETLWNNPITTYEMIETVHHAGFNAIRIPITFFNHTAEDTNIIDSGWLDRIQEVVEYAYYQDMYVILCMDNDGSASGWLKVNSEDSGKIREKYAALWKQIAERFGEYDERVLFQGFNELIDTDETWEYPGEEDVNWVNDLNQLFVDTVRATGGRNKYRTLVLGVYAGSHEQEIIDGFRLPEDTVSDRLMVAVNAFAPALFCYNVEEGEDEEVSYTDAYEWGGSEDKAELDELFSKLNRRFVSNGIPVIIGEFCTADKGNTEARAAHAAYYTAAAAKHEITCFWWDDGSLLLRKALSWCFPEIVDAMVDSTSVHLRHVTVSGLTDRYYTGEAIIPELVLYRSESGTVSPTDAIPADAVVLKEGVDYEVMCFNNVEKGTAEVTVTGLGRYSGVRTEYFNIVEEPRAVDFLSVLSEDNPQLPFMIMISIPMLLLLAVVSGIKWVRRRDDDRVRATVGAAMAEEMQKRASAAQYGSEPALYQAERRSSSSDLNSYMDEGEYGSFEYTPGDSDWSDDL